MKTKSSHIKLDQTDRKILDILQSNAKITNTQLSKEIGLSPAPTLERVKKLETSRVIKSYHAMLDIAKIGLGIQTYAQVIIKGSNKKNIKSFENAINNIPEVIECHHIVGSGDFILKIVSRDIEAYQQLMVETVSSINVVDRLQSMIILSTSKDSKIMPIAENE